MLYTSKSGLQCWRAIAGPDGEFPAHFAWGYGCGLVVDPRYAAIGVPMAEAGSHCRERDRHITEVAALLPGGGIIWDCNGTLTVWIRRDQLVIATRAIGDVIRDVARVDLRPLLGTRMVAISRLPYDDSDFLGLSLVAAACVLADGESAPPQVTRGDEVELDAKADGGEVRLRREWTVAGQAYILPRDAVIGIAGDTAGVGVAKSRSAAIFDGCSADQIATITAAIECREIEKYEDAGDIAGMTTPEVVEQAHRTRDAFLAARAAGVSTDDRM